MTPQQFQSARLDRLNQSTLKHEIIGQLARMAAAELRRLRGQFPGRFRRRRRAGWRPVQAFTPDGIRLGRPFGNSTLAGRRYGLSRNAVIFACQCGRVTRAGVRFAYVGRPLAVNHRPPARKAVVRIRDGRVFLSLTEVIPKWCRLDKAEYRKELTRLTRAVRRARQYRGEVYMWATAAQIEAANTHKAIRAT